MNKIKISREEALVELKNRLNKIYADNGFTSRMEIHQVNGEGQFKLNITDSKEANMVIRIMTDEFQSLGINQMDAELQDKK